MAQLLSVSRAARLAGVTRSEFQKKIGSGELQTFEGKVQITDLLRVFPQIDLDHDPTLEQIERIKADAHVKFPWQQSEPPSVEILLRRLQTLSDLLVQTKTALDRNVELLETTARRLEELGEEEGSSTAARDQIRALHRWLTESREKRDLEPDSAAILFSKNLLLHIIAPSVQIIPSGHEFQVEGGDTVLDAAIRSGHNVGYGCNDATCGACKARVVSGQILETRTPDHVLSDHEKRMGYMLMCCNTAVTDLMLEAAETSSPADLPWQNVGTTVSGVQQLSEDSLLLRLKTPKTQNFRFFAGQRATLTLSGGAAKTLPIVSCPCDRENLHFIIQKRQDDPGSETLLAGLQPGETVDVTGPEGNFVLRDDSANPSLFIACDGGFAPIKSLIEHAISIDRIETYRLYRYASPGTPVFYHNLCRSWQDAFDNFTYTNLELGGDPGSVGSPIVDDIPDLGRFDAYVAGPQVFTDAVRKILIENSLPADRLRYEILPD